MSVLRVMSYLRVLPFLIVIALVSAAPTRAEQALPQSQAVEVTGIAPGDLLNIRATATAGGLLIARFENGAILNNLGCTDVEGTAWCKVQSADDPKIIGWAAARYLLDLSEEEGALPPTEE